MGKDGADGFMPRYLRGVFNSRRVVYGYERGKWAYAFVMRSMRLVCVDIDGKNGGLEHAKKLGLLPPTLAETSKSGDGYHLFYLVDEEWDDEKRATACSRTASASSRAWTSGRPGACTTTRSSGGTPGR